MLKIGCWAGSRAISSTGGPSGNAWRGVAMARGIRAVSAAGRRQTGHIRSGASGNAPGNYSQNVMTILLSLSRITLRRFGL